MRKIVLIGAGGHCKVIIDLIKGLNQYEIIGITDNNKKIGDKILGIPVVGDDSILQDVFNKEVNYAFICLGALGNLNLRSKIYNNLKRIGFELPILIHKNAVISQYAHIEEGSCVMAGALINPEVYIKANCIVNTGAVVEHDCKIGFNCHISPNVSIGGGSVIGNNSHIGIGSTIIQGITIGNNATIGAGAAVIRDVGSNSTVIGVPAKKLL